MKYAVNLVLAIALLVGCAGNNPSSVAPQQQSTNNNLLPSMTAAGKHKHVPIVQCPPCAYYIFQFLVPQTVWTELPVAIFSDTPPDLVGLLSNTSLNNYSEFTLAQDMNNNVYPGGCEVAPYQGYYTCTFEGFVLGSSATFSSFTVYIYLNGNMNDIAATGTYNGTLTVNGEEYNPTTLPTITLAVPTPTPSPTATPSPEPTDNCGIKMAINISPDNCRVPHHTPTPKPLPSIIVLK